MAWGIDWFLGTHERKPGVSLFGIIPPRTPRRGPTLRGHDHGIGFPGRRDELPHLFLRIG
jgi:hypothetical protein